MFPMVLRNSIITIFLFLIFISTCGPYDSPPDHVEPPSYSYRSQPKLKSADNPVKPIFKFLGDIIDELLVIVQPPSIREGFGHKWDKDDPYSYPKYKEYRERKRSRAQAYKREKGGLWFPDSNKDSYRSDRRYRVNPDRERYIEDYQGYEEIPRAKRRFDPPLKTLIVKDDPLNFDPPNPSRTPAVLAKENLSLDYQTDLFIDGKTIVDISIYNNSEFDPIEDILLVLKGKEWTSKKDYWKIMRIQERIPPQSKFDKTIQVNQMVKGMDCKVEEAKYFN